jgi:putative metallopeptidase
MSTLNITAELERLIGHIAANHEEFRHVDPGQLLVCVSSTRGGGVHGAYAKIHPLRFPGGATTTRLRRGRRHYTCTMPTITHQDREMLYLIYFLVPRFLNLPVREKLITIFHELYHISPAFDGDIRRFPGRNFAHGSSCKRYNLLMARFVDEYLALPEAEEKIAFLKGNQVEMRARHRAIVGRKMAAPRLKLTPA